MNFSTKINKIKKSEKKKVHLTLNEIIFLKIKKHKSKIFLLVSTILLIISTILIKNMIFKNNQEKVLKAIETQSFENIKDISTDIYMLSQTKEYLKEEKKVLNNNDNFLIKYYEKIKQKGIVEIDKTEYMKDLLILKNIDTYISKNNLIKAKEESLKLSKNQFLKIIIEEQLRQLELRITLEGEVK